MRSLGQKIKSGILLAWEKVKRAFFSLRQRVKHTLPVWGQKIKSAVLLAWEKTKLAFLVLKQKIKLALLMLGRKLKLSPLTLGRKELVGLALIYVLIVFLLSLLIKFQAGSLRRTSKELAENRPVLEEARMLIENREKYGRDIEGLRKRIKSYEAKLPESKEVSNLFRELDKIAAESRVKFVSVGEELSEEEKHYRRIYWDLQLAGGYHELGRFINKLENLDRFIKIDDIQINSNPDNLLKHNIRLEVSTFVSKD